VILNVQGTTALTEEHLSLREVQFDQVAESA
jgi:hypothetical protein